MRIKLRCVNLWKSFDQQMVLKGVSLEVNQGEILTILGPSGGGKSTLLAIIAGVLPPDQGELRWEDQIVTDVPPHKRNFGLMFQDYVLFPHLNVYENIAFGLRIARMSESAIRARVIELLELVDLKGYENRDVNSLSGGEQQRVALARTLAPKPRLLMLDEPLASVDRTLQERLLTDLRAILRRLNLTTIYVTHNQEEAFSIANRVVLLHAGQVEQIGTPEELYNRPASLFAARFLGMTNLIPGRAIQINGSIQVQTDIGLIPSEKSVHENLIVLIKPDSANLFENGDLSLEGYIVEKTFRGAICQIVVQVNKRNLVFNFLSNTSLPAVGESIRLYIDTKNGILYFNSHNG